VPVELLITAGRLRFKIPESKLLLVLTQKSHSLCLIYKGITGFICGIMCITTDFSQNKHKIVGLHKETQ